MTRQIGLSNSLTTFERRRHHAPTSTSVYCLKERKSLKKIRLEHQQDSVVWKFDDDVILRLRSCDVDWSAAILDQAKLLKTEKHLD
jgi:hypothetical protein